MNEKSMVIYHANCPDGFGSAYAFWRKYGDLFDYCPLKHGEQIPDNIDGKRLWLADFCFKMPEMKEVLDRAYSVTVIDHHITAIEQLDKFEHPKLKTVFDTNHSGAVLSWMYLNPNREIPTLLRYIEDRDINTWQLEGAEPLLLNLDSREMTFESWHEFAEDIETDYGLGKAIDDGKILLNYKRELSNSIKRNVYTMMIGDVEFPVINTAIMFRGDILNEIAKESKNGVAAAYNFNGEEFLFSLRSSGDVDVEKIAKSFPGGGGHKCAAGFKVLSLKDL